MGQFNSMKLTKKGLALFSKVQTGEQLQFTKVAVGDGSLSSGQSLETLTALVHKKFDLPIASIDLNTDGTAKIRTYITNQNLTTGVYVREIGLFADDPVEGEILYAVANSGTLADYLPPKGTDVIEENINIITIVGNASNVTAIINESLAYATAKELNNVKDALKNHINDNAAVIREAIPSGMTKFSTIDYTYMKTNPNKIKLTGGGVAFVNGFKVDIPDGTIITLPDPPVSGERDDLVFLEVWLDQPTDTEGAKVNSRIRVVQGVNFNVYSKDGFHSNASWAGINRKVLAQGGNVAPLAENTNTSMDNAGAFIEAISSNAFVMNFANPTDAGLYVTGRGNQTSKDALRTADGYVYAIPLFRVRRRNSGGFSVNNPNGALVATQIKVLTTTNTIANIECTFQLIAGQGALLSAGDVLLYQGNSGNNIKATVTYVNGDTIKAIPSFNGSWNNTTDWFVKKSSRPDQLYADIIDDRDIGQEGDLRHLVSLTGFNYQSLLEENFDKLCRGELRTRKEKKMLKTYHGIRKTPIDANTVFYASLDGTTVAEVGGEPSVLTKAPTFKVSPIGLSSYDGQITYELSTQIALNSLSLEFFMYNDKIPGGSDADYHILLKDESDTQSFGVATHNTDTNGMRITVNSKTVGYLPFKNLNEGWHHYRIAYGNAYVDGAFFADLKLNSDWLSFTVAMLQIFPGTTKRKVCDVALSNIDRGATFATLPQDFIAGYARIMPAMNKQRKIHSDALTAQYTVGIAKGAGNGHSKGLTVTQATPGTWASGDTIKVKGLAGEIISGVIDTDTALARILAYVDDYNFLVDDVAKLAVNDTFVLMSGAGTLTSAYTITAIDTTNNKVTINSAATNTGTTWLYMIETTASTSVPVVKFMNAGTMTTVTGTWSSLANNEATFTLGTNASLVNADLQIEYSLNMAAGQGGVPEVYTATLEGSAKGKKLVIGTVAVRDDFAGKVAGSMIESPNIAKSCAASSLQAPSGSFSELMQSGYDSVKTLDSTTAGISTAVNGQLAQQLFSFDLVKIIEGKYGSIPSVDKVAWLKANINKITCNWYGYGNCPSGNKAYLRTYNVNTNAWNGSVSHSIGSVSVITQVLSSDTFPAYTDSNGIIPYLVYTDASNGTVASTIYTDYINAEIELKCPTGYDMLVPENPRRDDGQANVLLVRKETKEIQSFFDAANTDDLVTFGDYVPYQGGGSALYTGLTKAIIPKTYKFKAITTGTGSPLQNVVRNPYYSTQLPLAAEDYNLKNEYLTNTNISLNELEFDGLKLFEKEVGGTFEQWLRDMFLSGANGTTNLKRGINNRTSYYQWLYRALKLDRVTASLGCIALFFVANGEIYMLVNSTFAQQAYVFLGINLDVSKPLSSFDVFKIAGRPLVKGV